MKIIWLIFISFISMSIFGFGQIYTLKNNEKVKDSYIVSENDFAVIIEKNDRYSGITYDILYKGSRISGYKDCGIIKILPNGTLVATMLKPSVAKDVWVLIYGDIEQEFDSIEKIIFSNDGNIVVAFARVSNNGIILVNGIASVEYSELFDVSVEGERYSFSYKRGDEYYINIDGVEKLANGKANKITFSKDGSKLVYVINEEEYSVIVDGDNISEPYKSVDAIAISDNNMLAYAAQLMPSTNVNNTNESATNEGINITNVITNNYYGDTNLSNMSVYTNEEGITVKGPSNTIALMSITNIVNNKLDIYTNYVYTNDLIKTAIFLNGRMYGEYDNITNMRFSPEDKSLLFVTLNTNDNLYRISVGGALTENYNDVYLYEYSEDGSLFAYGVKTNNTAFIILNGRRLPDSYNSINNFYFSSNNNFVYNVEVDGREYIIASDFESPSYNDIISFKFFQNSFVFTGQRLGRYYYFIHNISLPFIRELGSYDYISLLSEYSDSPMAIVADNGKVYIIKDGVILKNNE